MSTELSARSELKQLLTESSARVDYGEPARVTKVCAEGLALPAPGIDLDLEQFAQTMILRGAASHATRQWTNLRILDVDVDVDVDAVDVDVALVVCVHRREKGADVTMRRVGDVADLWAPTPDGRRVASRRVTPFFDAPQA
jgi:hypothetical protein